MGIGTTSKLTLSAPRAGVEALELAARCSYCLGAAIFHAWTARAFEDNPDHDTFRECAAASWRLCGYFLIQHQRFMSPTAMLVRSPTEHEHFQGLAQKVIDAEPDGSPLRMVLKYAAGMYGPSGGGVLDLVSVIDARVAEIEKATPP